MPYNEALAEKVRRTPAGTEGLGPQATRTTAGLEAWIDFARAQACKVPKAKKRPAKRRSTEA